MEADIATHFQFYMLAGIFIIGMLTFITGVIILLLGIWGYDQQTLITQTSRLAQKGISEELSGLVGNASLLITAINDMVRTRNGIGIMLIITGAILMIAAYWFTQPWGIY
jgi:hypothetical protein